MFMEDDRTIEEYLPRGMLGWTRITNALWNHFYTHEEEEDYTWGPPPEVLRAVGFGHKRSPRVLDVCKLTRRELLRAENFGMRCCSILEEALADGGFSLKQEEEKIKKTPRRRVWVPKDKFLAGILTSAWPVAPHPDDKTEYIEFIEVPSK